eukprot:14692308-Alexandrium_andersonii.AAC.1
MACRLSAPEHPPKVSLCLAYPQAGLNNGAMQSNIDPLRAQRIPPQGQSIHGDCCRVAYGSVSWRSVDL